ncbi:putative phage tail protein [Yersinia pseudotuberculosis]|uniref:prophage tail fiber N-terminal domain-containing protein n=2 Tax=Yersinia pseudotuberculosis TaxID=633 RepID=UPI00061C9638|nr:prophage tail fiber N-terminal domain-containing protein [Yersinia pseudotuberculosis]CNI98139.1 putative phage tail protein [Yersinia pseudotuberculosis]
MSIKISGVLPGPTGEPAAHIGITLRAVKTSLTVITTLESNSITGADGSYSLNVEPGQYDVLLWVDGINTRNVGTITVYSDSLAGTLNNFLTALREEDGTPEIIRQLEQLRAEALQAALEASESKDEAIRQAGIATDAAMNAAQEATDLITAAVKDDADRAEAARDRAETAKSDVDSLALLVAKHHTEIEQLATEARDSATLAANSSDSASQAATESGISKDAAVFSANSALSAAELAGTSAAAAADDKAEANGFRDEAEEFAAQAKASADSIDMSALESLINEKASTDQLTTELAKKMDIAGGEFTGPILMSRDATEPLEPVTFQQFERTGGEFLLSVKWHMSRNYIPAGWAPMDGQLLPRNLFPFALAEVLSGKYPVVADDSWVFYKDWRSSFSVGDGSTTFRIPDLNGKFEDSIGAVVLKGDGKNSFGEMGRIQGDAIRNITGDFGSLGGQLNNAYGIVIGSKNGVFAGHGESGRPTSSNIGEPALGSEFIAFDASRVVPTAVENRVVNATGCYIIKLAGSALNEGQINALELATQMTQLASRTTSLESDAFTASKIANTSWTNLTLLNGWTQFNGEMCAVRRVNGVAQLSITAGGGANGVLLASLPIGYRPKRSTRYPVVSRSTEAQGAFAALEANGDIVTYNVNNFDYISFTASIFLE